MKRIVKTPKTSLIRITNCEAAVANLQCVIDSNPLTEDERANFEFVINLLKNGELWRRDDSVYSVYYSMEPI